MTSRFPARILMAGLLILLLAGLLRPAHRPMKRPRARRRSRDLFRWSVNGKARTPRAGEATYTLVSGGTALMERVKSANEPEMITLYSLDGDHLLVTHYCSMGNQPQMKTATITELGSPLAFKIVQVTGMKSPDEAHMVGLILTMPDKDHFTQQWTYKDKGKEQANVFKFTRKS